jgi:transglutaminase-like putative cysteine protease
MADEEPQPQSIAERIARLKVSQVGQPHQPTSTPKPNGLAGKARAPPPPTPARPNGYNRAVSTNNPPLADHGDHVSNRAIGNQPEEFHPDMASANGMDGISRPALPARTSTQSSQASLGPKLPARTTTAASPALPPRRPSEMTLSRKASNDSVSSMGTTHSSMSMRSNGTSITSRSERYAIRAPEFNQAALPPLPPKRTKEEVQAHEQKYNAIRPGGSTSSSLSSVFRKSSAPNIPTRPQLPGRPTLPARTSVRQEQATPIREEAQSEPPVRRAQAPPPPKRSALTMGFGNPSQPKQEPTSPMLAIGGVPPPIPTSSRPDLAALQASKPTSNGTPAPSLQGSGAGSCLHCRDFSGPDNHAARFPRQSLPSTDIGWLAHQLTSPFPSLTDKARVIFTWLHHNVAYDVVALCNNAVKSSTPQSTIASGLAVCEGYAGLFAALGVKAGLEVIVLHGASKGGSHRQIRPGESIPPFKSTHAWNVCRIDGGEWKLIDSCWGAGNTDTSSQTYTASFKPHHFTQSNIDFGRSHFPTDNSQQFREDGCVQPYEEYVRGTKTGTQATTYSGFTNEEGLSESSFGPTINPIVLSQQGPTTRFTFQKVCPHWDPVRHGRGPYYLYILNLESLEGTDRNGIPFQQSDGVWWCDVPTTDLGRSGQKVQIYTVTSFDNRDGRGLTLQEYTQRKNRVGRSFGGVAKWEIG